MLNEKSRVRGDFQARFCERLGLKCPCLLDRWSPAAAGAAYRYQLQFWLDVINLAFGSYLHE